MKRIGMILVPILVAGCTGNLLAPSGPAPALYNLAAPTQIATTASQANWQLLVDMPNATLDLNSARIAIVPAPSRIDYYADVAWVDRAPAVFQALLVESFDRSGRIAAVQRQGGGLRADYVLATDLRDFQVEAAQGAPTAHLRVTARLIRMRDRSIVANRTFEATAPVGGSGFDGVVGAFDAALAGLLPDLVTWTLAEGSHGP